jgi:hypothetical protein
MKMRAAAFFLAVGTVGCVSNYENPFQTVGGTVAPPTTSDLLFLKSETGDGVRDLYALDVDGAAAPVRLTACAKSRPVCSIDEAAPAPDRQRVAVSRRSDANGDLIVQPDEPARVFVVDLARGIEGQILPDAKNVDSLQWTTEATGLYYSGTGLGGLADLFRSEPDGTGSINVTTTSGVRERHSRVVGLLLTYERFNPTPDPNDANDNGLSQIWFAFAGTFPLTTGDPSLGGAPLPGTDYRVGGDADGEPSPDGSQIAFRRLVGLGEGGRGAWDLLKAVEEKDALGNTKIAIKTIETGGGAFRGTPAWGSKGIAFVEIPAGSATANLILVDPDSGNRRVLLSGAPLTLQSPRWLP